MVDGSVLFFFFAHILKTIWYFFLIVSGSFKRWFSTYFGIFLEKKRNVIFFKKFLRNQTSLFHGKFYKYFSNFSKTTQSFFPIVFDPLRKVAQDSFCTKKQKSKNFAFFSINFYDFYQKKHNSQKLLNIFF